MDTRTRLQVAKALRATANVLHSAMSEAEEYLDKLQDLRDVVSDSRDIHDDPQALWQAWYKLYYAGRRWAAFVVDNVSIPSRSSKNIEMAIRLFVPNPGHRGPRAGVIAWFDKNEKRLDVLAEAVRWPRRSEENDVFRHGPFMVHNVVGASAVDIKFAMQVVDIAMANLAKSELPGLKGMAYGPIYLVGQIERKNWAAWYMPKKDAIYLRPKIRGKTASQNAKTLIHELSHRYWAKELSNKIKQDWTEHHARMVAAPVQRRLPEVNDVLPLIVNNKKVVVDRYERGTAFLTSVDTKAPVGQVSINKLRDWLEDTDRFKKFPSLYAAKGGAEEHFAESVSLKAMGELSPENVKSFDEIVLGQIVETQVSV